MPTDHALAYRQRMRRVLDHLDAALEDALDTALLGEVAAFSRFHFQRQFAALYAMPVGGYLRALRLRQAGLRLAYRPDEPILQIALAAGYDSGEAFARAFRKFCGQAPSEFRSDPAWARWRAAIAPLDLIRSKHMPTPYRLEDVKITDFAPVSIAVITHHGPHETEGETIRRFIGWRKANGLSPARSRTFNLCYNDPFEAGADYRIDIAASCDAPVAPNDTGVSAGEIAGGRCAVLRVHGPTDDLRSAWTFLYGEWLPQSGEEPRDAPPFVERIAFFPDVPPAEAVTDLYLPLR